MASRHVQKHVSPARRHDFFCIPRVTLRLHEPCTTQQRPESCGRRSHAICIHRVRGISFQVSGDRGVTMAKTARQQKSPIHRTFVSITRFRELESEVCQMRDAMESIRHESSDNLRRCGELQCEVDQLKKAGASSREKRPLMSS